MVPLKRAQAGLINATYYRSLNYFFDSQDKLQEMTTYINLVSKTILDVSISVIDPQYALDFSEYVNKASHFPRFEK